MALYNDPTPLIPIFTAEEAQELAFAFQRIHSITGESPSIAALGSTIITNGSFTSGTTGWTATNWSWSGGVVTHTAGNTSALSQTIDVIGGTLYLLQFTVAGSDPLAGTSKVYIDGTLCPCYNTLETSNPGVNYASYLPALSGSVLLQIVPSTDFVGGYTAISVKPVTVATAAFEIRSALDNTSLVEFYGTRTHKNVGIGQGALHYAVNGDNNVAIGNNCLASNIEGDENTAIGIDAMRNNTVGYANVGIGWEALNANISGFLNTAVGHQSLGLNTYGGYNTAVGPGCLYSNISGFSNVALGVNALYRNVSGAYAIGIGSNALGKSLAGENISIGIDSMTESTDGKYNVAIGQYAMQVDVHGNDNISIGIQTLQASTDSSDNCVIGSQAMSSLTTGEGNTCLGRDALGYQETGDYNTAIGNYAGVTNVLAYRNITGEHNTWIGAYSGPGSATQIDNSIGVGYQSHPTESNSAHWGNSAITKNYFWGDFELDSTTGTKFGSASTQKLGFYGATPVVQRTDGATLTNNVTSGGTTNTIANYTDLTVYANDAAAIRNNIYQLARKVKILTDALRDLGLTS